MKFQPLHRSSDDYVLARIGESFIVANKEWTELHAECERVRAEFAEFDDVFRLAAPVETLSTSEGEDEAASFDVQPKHDLLPVLGDYNDLQFQEFSNDQGEVAADYLLYMRHVIDSQKRRLSAMRAFMNGVRDEAKKVRARVLEEQANRRRKLSKLSERRAPIEQGMKRIQDRNSDAYVELSAELKEVDDEIAATELKIEAHGEHAYQTFAQCYAKDSAFKKSVDHAARKLIADAEPRSPGQTVNDIVGKYRAGYADAVALDLREDVDAWMKDIESAAEGALRSPAIPPREERAPENVIVARFLDAARGTGDFARHAPRMDGVTLRDELKERLQSMSPEQLANVEAMLEERRSVHETLATSTKKKDKGNVLVSAVKLLALTEQLEQLRAAQGTAEPRVLWNLSPASNIQYLFKPEGVQSCVFTLSLGHPGSDHSKLDFPVFARAADASESENLKMKMQTILWATLPRVELRSVFSLVSHARNCLRFHAESILQAGLSERMQEFFHGSARSCAEFVRNQGKIPIRPLLASQVHGMEALRAAEEMKGKRWNEASLFTEKPMAVGESKKYDFRPPTKRLALHEIVKADKEITRWDKPADDASQKLFDTLASFYVASGFSQSEAEKQVKSQFHTLFDQHVMVPPPRPNDIYLEAAELLVYIETLGKYLEESTSMFDAADAARNLRACLKRFRGIRAMFPAQFTAVRRSPEEGQAGS